MLYSFPFPMVRNKIANGKHCCFIYAKKCSAWHIMIDHFVFRAKWNNDWWIFMIIRQNVGFETIQNVTHPTNQRKKYSIKDTLIECEGWRWHSSLIFLILLFTKPNIEVIGWLYQTKTHFTHIVHQPFSRVSPPSFTLYGDYSVSFLSL